MMAILQILVNGVILFFLYRFFIKTIGAEQFGIWALVMAFTSFASVANLGFAGSVVKFVAQSQANDDKERTAVIIQTAAISIAVISGVLMMILFPVVSWSMKYFVGSSSLPMAILLLPYSFTALWLMMIGGIFLSALDGYKRTDIRGLIMICVSASNLTLCVLLVPKLGLIGVAYSIICSNCFALMSGWVMIKRSNPLLPFLPFIWRKSTFKEIIGYATKFQIATLAAMFCEPVTKAFLSKFGGLSIVAYYEMASRLVLQLRALIVSAYQVLVPVFAEHKENSPEKISLLYGKSYDLIYYLSLPSFVLIIVWLPLISEVWLGHIERTFIIIGSMLVLSWFINTLAIPAYVANVGLGIFKWYLTGNLIMAFLNVTVGYGLGFFLAGYGVIGAMCLAIIIGSIVIMAPYHIKMISIKGIISTDNRLLSYFALIITLVSIVLMIFRIANARMYLFQIVSFIILLFLIFFHPARKQIQKWLFASLLRIK